MYLSDRQPVPPERPLSEQDLDALVPDAEPWPEPGDFWVECDDELSDAA